MIDILSIFGIWSVSLLVAFLSVYQPKGEEWYAPKSNKTRMIMTLLNTAILLVLLIYILYSIHNDDLKIKVLIISAAFVGITLFLSFTYIVENILKKKDKPNQQNSSAASNSTSSRKNYRQITTLREVLSTVLTFFNTAFVCLNVIYVFILVLRTGGFSVAQAEVQQLLTSSNVIIVHSTILFWNTILAIILTSNGWKYNDEINGTQHRKKQIKYDADYYANRITGRNKP